MGKMKTHKGITKRIKLSRRGKLKFKKPGASHLMSGKSGKRCRNLRRRGNVQPAIAAKIKHALST